MTNFEKQPDLKSGPKISSELSEETKKRQQEERKKRGIETENEESNTLENSKANEGPIFENKDAQKEQSFEDLIRKIKQDTNNLMAGYKDADPVTRGEMNEKIHALVDAQLFLTAVEEDDLDDILTDLNENIEKIEKKISEEGESAENLFANTLRVLKSNREIIQDRL